MLENNTPPTIRDLLEPVLPPILFRNHPKFKEWTGLSPRTVANEDSQGRGPTERVVIGNVTGYPRDPFLDYLARKAKLPCQGKNPKSR